MGLVCENLVKVYKSGGDERVVLDGVSLSAAPGESVAIMGPSGSGKSTFLNIVGAIDNPDSGEVILNNQSLSSLDERGRCRYRNLEIGFVFQDHLLLPQCTAIENVLLPVMGKGSDKEAGERAMQLLEKVGLGNRSGAFPSELSGGERQRVAVARALINRPKMLLCDEPTGNLDRDNGFQVAQLFLDVAGSDGVMVLLATHDHNLAEKTDRILNLIDGKLREE